MGNLNNLVQFRPSVRIKRNDCPVTCWEMAPDKVWTEKIRKFRCAKPLAPGARFCAKHEADRIRLSR